MEKSVILRQAVSLVMLAGGMVMSALDAGWFTAEWVRAVWYAVAFLPVGLGVIKEAWECAAKGDVFSEFMLMSVAAVGAFLIGEYPEAVAVMLFYCIGEALQDMAVDRARDNIKAMMEFRPDRASVLVGDKTEVKSPGDVRVGDIIEVRPGERVPLDGRLEGPSAAFDTAALTGESVPRTIESGGEVLAGMVAADSVVRLRVVREAGQSAVARILQMVEEASERKAPAELFIRRFARVYTPAVFGLAVLVVLVPWLLSAVGLTSSYDFGQWFGRALIFLVIACPCALVISVPLGYFAGIGAASRLGILFKGGGSLDAISSVDTVAFDKTGTLTAGTFEVRRVEGLSNADLAMVAAMERSTSHPVARAIVEYAGHFAPPATMPDVKTVAGYGLEAGDWLAGTPRLLKMHDVSVPELLDDEQGTIVAVAAGGEYKGCIILGDVVRQDAREAVSRLGMHTVILSGDRQPIVDAVAEEIGADRGYGDLLPGDKAEYIASMQRDGHKVAFVGDGINDAPVLVTSDVGIAFGAGSADMAVETADAVIHSGKLVKIAEAVEAGRRTRRIVKQNIVLAIGFKVLVMILGLFGVANIWMAVFADTGVALLAVLNSMRIFSMSRGHKE